MPNPFDRTLSDWITLVEKKKDKALRAKLRIPNHLVISGLQLEALAYHLTERSGLVQIRFQDGVLRVGEPNKTGGGIPYHDDAAEFLLATWGVSAEEARRGIVIEVKNGARVVARH